MTYRTVLTTIAALLCATWLGAIEEVASSPAAVSDAPQAVPRDSLRAARMREHYADVLVVHQAVIRGDLAATRQPATTLATAPGPAGLPDVGTVYVRAMQAAARRAAAASDIAAAASATAAMIATCGGCHEAVGTRPAAAEPERPRVGGTVGHMLEHQRALNQMLQGLTLPSAATWRQGALALETAPLERSDLPPDRKLTSALRRVETDVHGLAADAKGAVSTEARTTVYGALLGKCAECHGLHRQIWGPGLP